MAKTTKRTRQLLKDRTRLEWALFILLLIIGYLLLASHFVWWPSHKTYENLGSAFYAGIPASAADTSAGTTASTSGGSSTGSGGTTGTGGGTANTGGGSTPGGGSGGGGTGSGGGGTSSSSSGLLTFSGTLNTGDSKQDVSGRASGLNESCVVVVNTSTAGKQEVCTYTQGDKVVTVTYLNDHVVSASRSGF